jgi:tRNA nucleotidyltransferase/poly(A) polymerase
MATTAVPDVVMQRLAQAGIQAIPTGISHGTVTAVLPECSVEITTLRKDMATDGRHAQVTYTDCWEQDSARRDFTMNAVYLGLDGQVYDFHHGRADIKASRVVFVGNPQDRVREDALRILRYFRFMAYYGMSDDVSVLNIMAKSAPRMKILSAERITGELMRLMMAPQAGAALATMKKYRILAPLGLNIGDVHLLQETALPPMGRWYAVFGPGSNPHITLSRAQQQEIKDIQIAQELLEEDRLSSKALAVAVSWGAAATALALGGRWAEAEKLKGDPLPTFPLKGQDVMALGIGPGPQVGKVLEQVKNWWLQEGFPTRRACLTEMKRVIKTEQ